MVRQQHPGMQRGSTVVLCCFEVTLSNLHYVMCLIQIDLKPHIHGESGPQCDSASNKKENKIKEKQNTQSKPDLEQKTIRTAQENAKQNTHKKNKSNIKTKPKENPVYSTFICGCCLFALFLHVFPSCRFLFALFSRLLCFFLRCFTCSKILVTRSPAKEKEREKKKTKATTCKCILDLFCFVLFFFCCFWSSK